MDMLELVVLYALRLKANGHIEALDRYSQGNFWKWVEMFNEYPEDRRIYQLVRFLGE